MMIAIIFHAEPPPPQKKKKNAGKCIAITRPTLDLKKEEKLSLKYEKLRQEKVLRKRKNTKKKKTQKVMYYVKLQSRSSQ